MTLHRFFSRNLQLYMTLIKKQKINEKKFD